MLFDICSEHPKRDTFHGKIVLPQFHHLHVFKFESRYSEFVCFRTGHYFSGSEMLIAVLASCGMILWKNQQRYFINTRQEPILIPVLLIINTCLCNSLLSFICSNNLVRVFLSKAYSSLRSDNLIFSQRRDETAVDAASIYCHPSEASSLTYTIIPPAGPLSPTLNLLVISDGFNRPFDSSQNAFT